MLLFTKCNNKEVLMNFVFDPINVVNIVLCIVITILGFIGRNKMESSIPLFIAIAFGLFGISHIVTLFGLHESWRVILIVIRTIAYLSVVWAVYSSAFQKKV